jgi:hypothetical protein
MQLNEGNTNVYKYGLGDLLIEYMGDRRVDERAILKWILAEHSYIVKFLRIGRGVFLKMNENSISIIIGNFHMSYPSSDGVPAQYNESVALTN